MPEEIEIKVNKLLFSDRQNVTNTAQQIADIFTVPANVFGTSNQIKTMVITNNSANTIYFGADNSVATSDGGGIIYKYTSREIPMIDLNLSPFFIAASNSEIGIEIWG